MPLRQLLFLERPLVGIDVETHAFVPPERSHIVEVGFKILYPGDREPKRWVSYIKPPVPITTEAEEKHHISNEMVKDAPTWEQLAPNLAKGLTNCDFCGYHVRFDLRVIYAEMARVRVPWAYEGARLVDGSAMWRVSVPRTLTDALREFCGREPTGAHRALEDAEDAIDAAAGILRRFNTLPRTIQSLHDTCFVDAKYIDPDRKFMWTKEGEAAFNFGKHNGWLLKDTPTAYLEWMVGPRGDFPPEVKRIVSEALKGKFPAKETI